MRRDPLDWLVDSMIAQWFVVILFGLLGVMAILLVVLSVAVAVGYLT